MRTGTKKASKGEQMTKTKKPAQVVAGYSDTIVNIRITKWTIAKNKKDPKPIKAIRKKEGLKKKKGGKKGREATFQDLPQRLAVNPKSASIKEETPSSQKKETEKEKKSAKREFMA